MDLRLAGKRALVTGASKGIGRAADLSASLPGRPATPEAIANAVAFLASPRSACTTGTILTIDGAPG